MADRLNVPTRQSAALFRTSNVNACKTFGCQNFGVLGSPSYLQRGENILCQACGFPFPVISAAALNAFKAEVNRNYQGVIRACPHCGRRDSLIRNGYAENGRQRLLCTSCRSTFVWYEKAHVAPHLLPLAQLIRTGGLLRDFRAACGFSNKTFGRALHQLAFAARIASSSAYVCSLDPIFATATFTLGFNHSANRLYVVVTAEKASQQVIALTTNYAPPGAAIAENYRYHADKEERLDNQNPVARIFAKDRQIKQRDLLFDTCYGAARLKVNDAGTMVKPVLAAYRHFEVVKSLTDSAALYTRHYLEHECFLYGGCLMANREEILSGHCHIAFVHEEGKRVPQRPYRSEVIASDIIWNDIWRTFSQPDYQMAVCSLTGAQRLSELRDATLQPARRFIDFVYRPPFYPQLVRLSPANVNAALECLAAQYNQTRG
ncbi:cytoplasmic protein [Cronobacter dublinensis]